MIEFSKATRQDNLDKMAKEPLDLLIIGGGITGAGVALQAAASGIKTGLIEMQDFSEGTSSRSTKLVHGGIRYLKTFDVEVVSDTVKERAIVQQIAPHIPKPDPMLLPIYDDEGPTTFDMFSVKIAMDLYDQLAGVKGTKYENYTLNAKEVLEREPYIKKKACKARVFISTSEITMHVWSLRTLNKQQQMALIWQVKSRRQASYTRIIKLSE